jgi:hypothetical protein
VFLLLIELAEKNLRHLVEGHGGVSALVVPDLVVARFQNVLERLNVVDNEEPMLSLSPKSLLNIRANDEIDEVVLETLSSRDIGDSILIEGLKDLRLRSIRDESNRSDLRQEPRVRNRLLPNEAREHLVGCLGFTDDDRGLLLRGRIDDCVGEDRLLLSPFLNFYSLVEVEAVVEIPKRAEIGNEELDLDVVLGLLIRGSSVRSRDGSPNLSQSSRRARFPLFPSVLLTVLLRTGADGLFRLHHGAGDKALDSVLSVPR